VSFTACTGESFFTASFALMLDELEGATSPHGTLVAIPHRHTLLFHAIRSSDAIFAVNTSASSPSTWMSKAPARSVRSCSGIAMANS
jgi:hypothetical protein